MVLQYEDIRLSLLSQEGLIFSRVLCCLGARGLLQKDKGRFLVKVGESGYKFKGDQDVIDFVTYLICTFGTAITTKTFKSLYIVQIIL